MKTLCRRWIAGALSIVIIVTVESSPVAAQDAFDPACSIPYRHIATDDLAIDQTCGPDGEATKPAHAAQNRAKNNLCAMTQPINLTYAAFKALQRKVDESGMPYGSSNSLPADRTQLEDILKIGSRRVGEGDVVRYVGFIHNPRYSNTSNGESVNCKRGGRQNNDIHVDLLRTRDEDACRSVTFEVIPHFRPRDWEVDQLRQVTHPVRVTGHLFFDASHKPCEPGKEHNPKRVTVWEIHPVYQIEVCKFRSLSSCRVAASAVWKPLNEFLNIPVDEDEDDQDPADGDSDNEDDPDTDNGNEP